MATIYITSHPAGRLPTREHTQKGYRDTAGQPFWNGCRDAPESSVCAHTYVHTGARPQPSSSSPSERVRHMAEILIVKNGRQGNHSVQLPCASQKPTSFALAKWKVFRWLFQILSQIFNLKWLLISSGSQLADRDAGAPTGALVKGPRPTAMDSNAAPRNTPKELNAGAQTHACARVVTAALFTVAKRWKQPKGPNVLHICN